MPESMEGILVRIGAHLLQASPKPTVKFSTVDRGPSSVSGRDAEHGGIDAAVADAVQGHEAVQSADRAQKLVVRCGKRGNVHPGIVLVRLSQVDVKSDAAPRGLDDVLDPTPAQDAARVDRLAGYGDQGATAQHAQIVGERESLENLECGLFAAIKGVLWGRCEEVPQDFGSHWEGLLDPVLGSPFYPRDDLLEAVSYTHLRAHET